jgi:RNA polymerase-binding transcription factor DksA
MMKGVCDLWLASGRSISGTAEAQSPALAHRFALENAFEQLDILAPNERVISITASTGQEHEVTMPEKLQELHTDEVCRVCGHEIEPGRLYAVAGPEHIGCWR